MEVPYSLYAGAVVLGVIHGAEPGHGWPVAATYGMNRTRTGLHAFAASTLLGLGHLVSSVAVVAVYFLALSYFDVTRLPYVNVVAGVLLIALGIREYRHGHSHSHGEDEDGHSHGDHDHVDPGELSVTNAPAHAHDHGGHEHPHGHAHDHAHDEGLLARVKSALPFVGGHSHDHSHGGSGHSHDWGDPDTGGLAGIVTTAFVLGFAHEEEFEIIALCTGATDQCLPLMLTYAVAVLVALVTLTMLLVAGYRRYEDRVERYAEHFPTLSAVVLVVMGLAFLFGLA